MKSEIFERAGKRWGDEIITLTKELLGALHGGKAVGVDVQSEYVVFLRLENGEVRGG